MATYTPNHNLGKPDSSDQFSAFRQLFNDNMDKIDQISGGGGGGSGKILKNQTLVFNNNVATISDADIKADSDYAVYYYDEVSALSAGIVSSSSLGVITFTAQTTPLTTIIVDVVIFSASGGGGSSTFAGLSDVDFTNLQNGQVPKYNSTTQKWENANESGGGGTVYDDTERVVGTWFGDTLYQKTLILNNQNLDVSGTAIDITSLGVDMCCPVYSGCYYIVSGVKRGFQRIEYQEPNDLYLYPAVSRTGTTCYVTIQYTKA
jgi:hypothetical protein